MTDTVEFTVNGVVQRIIGDPEKPLLWVLRDELGLKGTKYGCGVGLCGICNVLIDGEPNHACMVPLHKAAGRKVVTIEGLGPDDRLVQAWIAEQVPQCGYCQPGQLLAGIALLSKNPNPTVAEINAAMGGVLCRCGTYQRIRRAIERTAKGDVDSNASTGPPTPDAVRQHALNDFVRIGEDGTVTVVINHSEMGQGALTGLVMLIAEELEIELSQVRTEFAPADPRYNNPMWDVQLTGGSSSIRGEWEPFRRYGAQARMMLITAAARQWGVRRGDCRAERATIIHVPSARSLGYGELAAAAAKEPTPQRVSLKPPSKFRLIGQPILRLDIPDMVAGRTVYAIDAQLPDMRVATVQRCPVIGGKVKAFDARPALGLPGVHGVYEVSAGVGIVAENFWAALKGREALHVTWDTGRHATLNNARIEHALQEGLERKGRVERSTGNVRQVLSQAPRVIEAVYTTPYLAHATLEAPDCVAHVRPDGCDIWVGTQVQGDTLKTAARITGLPRSKVNVHTVFLGGGFGRRLATDFVADAVELSKACGAPVQVLWTRADDLQHDKYRPAACARLQAAFGKDGIPSAWFLKLAGSELVLEGIDMPYAIPNLREEHVEVESIVPTGAWRSVGASQNAFALESFIDELAHASGKDPFAFRRKLLKNAPRHRAVLEKAAELAGWGSPLPPGHGRGIAVYHSFGSWVAQVAEVAVTEPQPGRKGMREPGSARDEDRGAVLTVKRVVCVIDCGIAVNPDAVRSQIEGGIAFGLSAALKEEIIIEEGQVRQTTFSDYPLLTLPEMPRVEAHIMDSTQPPGGVGEPPVPVIAPTVANAVFAATGLRLRRLPLRLSR